MKVVVTERFGQSPINPDTICHSWYRDGTLSNHCLPPWTPPVRRKWTTLVSSNLMDNRLSADRRALLPSLAKNNNEGAISGIFIHQALLSTVYIQDYYVLGCRNLFRVWLIKQDVSVYEKGPSLLWVKITLNAEFTISSIWKLVAIFYGRRLSCAKTSLPNATFSKAWSEWCIA